MIILKKSDWQKIIYYAHTQLPNEACGLLAGKRENNKNIIETVYLLTNIDHSPEHFSMDAKEQFTAVADMRKKGVGLLANFHSHPATPSRPSEEDKRLAFDPNISYLILSLAKKEPVLKSFCINNKISEEETIFIV